MSKDLKAYEIRGNYTITVSKVIYARCKEEAEYIMENSFNDDDINTEWNGSSVFSDTLTLTADGALEYNEVSEEIIYGSESDADESDFEDNKYEYDACINCVHYDVEEKKCRINEDEDMNWDYCCDEFDYDDDDY